MLRSAIAALNSIPDLIEKYRVLRDKRLLSKDLDHEQLEKYLYACNAMGRQRGYLRSLREGMCVDAQGNPLPWYTYPAIDQLSKWDFADAEVFEYGCGNSTRWWAQRARAVVSVESSETWYQKILESGTLPHNVTPILAPIGANEDRGAIERYVRAIDDFGAFDVIVVDGVVHAKARLACAEAALPHLRAGGMIILDNSDWLPEASQRLRDAGLLEIDFCGNAPLVTCAETTSLFLTKDFRVKPRHEIHPGFTLGGLQRQLG